MHHRVHREHRGLFDSIPLCTLCPVVNMFVGPVHSEARNSFVTDIPMENRRVGRVRETHHQLKASNQWLTSKAKTTSRPKISPMPSSTCSLPPRPSSRKSTTAASPRS